MKSKTIILSSQKKYENNSPRAILTFISDNKKIEGKLRLYNLNTLPPASKLGIYYESQVYTANLVKKDGAFSFFINENFNLDSNIYCAIIDKANNNVVLCGGTTNNFVYYVEENESEEDVEDTPSYKIEEKNVNSSNETTKSNTEKENITKEENLDPKNQSNCKNCADCENCVYKEYFYNHHSKTEEIELFNEDQSNTTKSNGKSQNIVNSEKDNFTNNTSYEVSEDLKVNCFTPNSSLEPSENVEKNTVDTLNKESEKFIQSITDQLDDMFKTYPEDEIIMKIIPNSKVVKVTDNVDEGSYIVGVIYELDEIKYLLYGVPSKYNEPAPKELGKNYQWLPLNVDDPLSDGYYLLYQDATSGKIVPIIVE